VKLTNLDRVVFPADGITKGELVAYHRDVAERMLPHLRGRPLSLERFRATIDDGGFYQQSVAKHFPAFIGRAPVDRTVGLDPDAEPVMPHARGRPAPAPNPKGPVTVHPVVEDADGLVYLSNQGTLTFHAWPARLPDLERPDALVLDLDPDADDDFAAVRRAAGLLREVLAELGLAAVPMLTGSRGLHVIVPLDGTLGWEGVWTMAKAIGAAHVARAPKELTRAFYTSQRRRRLYVDTGRARRGHTAVAPYTVRARPGAPVAAPVTWDEVLDPDGGLHARAFTVRDVLARPADPWAGARERGQSLRPAAAALDVELP
jgi:bifunctional non-homologous end joining protein LigD